MKESPGVTIMVHRDGAVESANYRIPLWALRIAMISGMTLGAVALVLVALYGPIVRAAARVPFLTREISRLKAENEQVGQLASRLGVMESRYAQVRSMLGADLVPRIPAGEEALPVAHAMLASAPGRKVIPSGPSIPQRWPLDERGVVTRGQIEGSVDETHPGIDIAIAMATPIRAAGGGTVIRTGRDPEYGLFVLVSHPDDYQTMYGHASRLLVSDGDEINAGQVIALSGSTGRSSAPHLHFEIRHNGRSVDPRTVALEDS